MRTTKITTAAGLLAATLTATLVGATVAQADPTPAAFRTYAAVGSDTTQDVWNGLTNGTGAPIAEVASYDAFGTATIQTKAGGPSFTRPAGSGNGVKALSASFDPANHIFNGVNIAGQVDFARSSSGPSATGTDLTYLPYARDAVTLAIKSTAGNTANVTTQQLADIYNCVPGKNTITVGTSTITVNPKLPQTGSGTRAFFLSAIGVGTPGTCVTTVGNENDGSQLTAVGDIIPFSAAQWIAQKNGVVVNTITSGEFVASVNGSAPTTGTAPNLAPGALYGDLTIAPVAGVGTFARDTYNVIASSALGTALETDTLTTKVKNNTAIISKYGFGNLSYVGVSANYKKSGYVH